MAKKNVCDQGYECGIKTHRTGALCKLAFRASSGKTHFAVAPLELMAEINSKINSKQMMTGLLKFDDKIILPANIVWKEDERSLTYFDSNEKIHRDDKDGPAVQTLGGARRGGSEEYRWHGMLHRDPKKGPALIAHGGESNGGYQEFWVRGMVFYDQDRAIEYFKSEDPLTYGLDFMDQLRERIGEEKWIEKYSNFNSNLTSNVDALLVSIES